MADSKISGLNELAETPANDDILNVVDISDVSMGVTGTNKKVTRANLVGGLIAGVGSSVDNTILRFDGTSGNIIQTSGVSISDTNEISGFITETFDTTYTPTGLETKGTLYWNEDEETLDLIQNGAVLQVGQELHIHVRNASGADITNGTVVMATGTIGASGRITVAPYTTGSNVKYIIGIATETIGNGTDGKVTAIGKVRGIDTSAWLEGDVLYVDNNGALTNVEPVSGLKNSIAFVINVHATVGTIMVRFTPVDEQTIDHTNLSNIGTNTHAQIDSHISSTSNPHSTSDANLVVTDVTTNNATALAHGFLPKLSGSGTQFLAGDGTYKTPSGTANAYTTQAFSSQTSIIVTHNFGAYPQVQVLDATNKVLIPNSITHNSVNDFTVTFSVAESGTIIANLGSPQPNNYTATGISYTATGDDYIINATTGGITVTLPTAVGAESRKYIIKNTSNADVFVNTTSSQTIDNELTATLKPLESLSTFSDGSNWYIY